MLDSMGGFVPAHMGDFLEPELMHWRERDLSSNFFVQPAYDPEKIWDPLVRLLKKLHHLTEVD